MSVVDPDPTDRDVDDLTPDNRIFPHGPDFEETGDPEWIEPRIAEGFARDGDFYTARSRWKERIYPSASHPAELNPIPLARAGFRSAFQRFLKMAGDLPESLEGEEELEPFESPTVAALVAVQDVLEWTHTLHEIYRVQFPRPTDADPVFGPFVTGALGARNAAHHDSRRVVGLVTVAPALYTVNGFRWVHTGTYPEGNEFVSVRWVEDLTSSIRLPYQREAYLSHLAGRDVHNTLNGIAGFYLYTVNGAEPPADLLLGPAHHPPPISATT
jgi:hypothetical protein